MEENKPIRIQRSRKHKQVSPNGLPVVYVGRPSRYGNEWKAKEGRSAVTCVELYENKLRSYKKEVLAEFTASLKGKNLSCWCKIGEPCHADVLLKLAND